MTVTETSLEPLPQDALQLLDDVLQHRGWARREGQVMMVQQIHDLMSAAAPGANVDIAVNAPVGTGKTLAYILAALAAGKRVVVATSTKSLQDQIIGEELPQLAEDLRALYGYDLTFGLLKGKSNYTCAAAVERMLSGAESADDDDELLLGDLDAAADTRDIDTLKDLIADLRRAQAEGDALGFDSERHFGTFHSRDTAKRIRASRRCGGKTEPWPVRENEFDPDDIESMLRTNWETRREEVDAVAKGSNCIYRAAYAHAMNSQVVVLNTTLLIYELLKAQSKFSELTPALMEGVGVVVVDEAHHLSRIMAEAYSAELDFASMSKTATDAARRVTKKYGEAAGKSMTDLVDLISHTESQMDLAIDNEELGEGALRDALNAPLAALADRVRGALLDTRTAVAAAAGPDEKVGRGGVPRGVAGLLSLVYEDVAEASRSAATMISRRTRDGEFSNNLSFLVEDDRLVVKMVPVDVSGFRGDLSTVVRQQNTYVGPPAAIPSSTVILSSGTITKRTPSVVGMEPDGYLDVPTPFDSRRVRLLVPPLPEPSSPRWLEESWELVREAIETTGGRTMILTTSRARLEEFTNLAREELPFEVFSQLDPLSKRTLVGHFKEDERSVLVGTTSFWEGVDVPGPALSLVVMDKAPFPPKDDPVFSARRVWVERHDGNPFMDVDVDHAAIMIAQGAGRLIRSTTDIGGVMLLDSRVNTKRYGDALLKLLPRDWPLTKNADAFLEWMSWVAKRDGEMPLPNPNEWREVRPVLGRRGRR